LAEPEMTQKLWGGEEVEDKRAEIRGLIQIMSQTYTMIQQEAKAQKAQTKKSEGEVDKEIKKAAADATKVQDGEPVKEEVAPLRESSRSIVPEPEEKQRRGKSHRQGSSIIEIE
jgi:hypothetical protein